MSNQEMLALANEVDAAVRKHGYYLWVKQDTGLSLFPIPDPKGGYEDTLQLFIKPLPEDNKI